MRRTLIRYLLPQIMPFFHFHAPHATPASTDLCLVIQADRLLAVARTDVPDAVSFPDFASLESWTDVSRPLLHVGLIDGRPIWLCSVEKADATPPEGWQWQETRALLSVFSAAQSHAISCARQLLWWERRHRFCGVCGTPTEPAVEERARRCPQCSAVFFPSVSPAVIMAVTRGNEILLAHNRNFRPGMFSVLAGFLDPGEALEQTVKREVREEVGIEIDGLRYVASQPWSFPNSLMVGFRANYVSGEVTPDGKEIEEAGWFSRTTLPEIPRLGTIARLLIDGWRNEEENSGRV